MGVFTLNLIFVLTQAVPKAIITKFAVPIVKVIVLIAVQLVIILVPAVPVVLYLAPMC